MKRELPTIDSGFFQKPVTRRSALKTLGLSLAAGVANSVFPFHLRAAAQRPNIIFILSDDHRWDMMSCMGHPFLKTPNLDRLSRQGTHFNNAFVTTSLCSPSRASFLTGQYAHSHGVQNNTTPWNNDNVTFLELLGAAGYETAFIGKWHMPGRLPELRRIDRFITFTAQGGQGRYFNCPLIIDGKEVPSRKPYITEELTDYALEFMSARREKPFCLYLSHKAVHHQFLPPPDLKGIYKDADLNLPREANSWITWSKGALWYGVMKPLESHYRDYCETIVSLDRQIGRVMKKAEELGIAENTVIVYAGDNGYFWGEHRLVDKRWPYEESIRIPFMIRYPRLGRQPSRPDHMVLNIDLAPTLLELAGIPVPQNMEGKSIVPILQNRKKPWRTAWLYEYFKDFPYQVPETRAVRTERYKYIDYASRDDEIYDIRKDPREMNNLMGTPEGKKIYPSLKKMLDALKKGKDI